MMNHLMTEFLTETNASLMAFERDKVRLGQNPNDKELIPKIFRLMHTIKAASGFLGLSRLETITRHGEKIMIRLRDGGFPATTSHVKLIFETFDRIKAVLDGLEKTGVEPQGDDSALLEKLDAACEGRAEKIKNDEPEAPVHAMPAVLPADPVVEPSSTAPSPRANINDLENLVTLASELVFTKNQVVEILRAEKGTDGEGLMKRLNQIVTNLHDSVMQTCQQPMTSVLIAESAGERFAFPQSVVRELVLSSAKSPVQIKKIKDTMFLRLRDRLFPLISLKKLLNLGADDATNQNSQGTKYIIIADFGASSFGLIVDRVSDAKDIVEKPVSRSLKHLEVFSGQTILGDGTVVMILNPGAIAKAVAATDLDKATSSAQAEQAPPVPEKISARPLGATNESTQGNRVLLIDDSPFFRNMLSSLLKAAGYSVTALDGPLAALKMRDKGKLFDLIVSDIEMPNMNGFEFAKKVREESSLWRKTPMIALTSHTAQPQDTGHGKNPGFARYISKFDRDGLILALSQAQTSDEAGPAAKRAHGGAR